MNELISSIYLFLDSIGYTHPVHSTQTYMPIGLVIGAFLFGCVSFVFRREKIGFSARHCIILAFIFLFPTILSGLMDWQYFYKGAWLFPIKMKMVLAGVLFILLFLALIVARRSGTVSFGPLTLYALSFLTVVCLGYFGGELVFGRNELMPPKQIEVGARLFELNCGKCHPGGGNVIMPNHPVIGSQKLSTFEEFLLWLRAPESPMPAFPESTMSRTQAKDLYQFIIHSFEKKEAN